MHVARSALGVRCVLASLVERKSLAERAARDVARFGLGTVAVSQKRREDAHALRKSGNCRTKPNSRVIDFTGFRVRNESLITPSSGLA